MRFLRQSTSVDLPVGPFLNETDGKTAETALTITQPDIRLKKNDAAWAQKAAAQTLTHEENGWYEVTLDATDTNTCGQLMLAIHKSGALPVFCEFHVLEEAIYDALFAASANAFSGAAGSTTLTALAANSITASVIATDAIDADSIAPNAIGSSELATTAVDEIVDQVWDEARAGHTTVGSFGEGVTSVQGNVTGSVASVSGAVGSVTGNVGGNVAGSVGSVTGNVGGNVSGSVGSVGNGGIASTSFAAGAIDAAAIAADAIGASELAAGAVDEILDDTIGDGTITVRQALRVILAAVAGKLTGAATTTVTIRNVADSADVVVATVDANGNRSAVTVTP